MENNSRTLGDVVREYAGDAVDRACAWVYDHRKGVGLAAAATVLYALYNGWENPTDFSSFSNPNFVRPGEDMQWDMGMTLLGIINSSVRYYVSHLAQNVAAMVGGGVADAVVRRVASIKVKRKEE